MEYDCAHCPGQKKYRNRSSRRRPFCFSPKSVRRPLDETASQAVVSGQARCQADVCLSENQFADYAAEDLLIGIEHVG